MPTILRKEKKEMTNNTKTKKKPTVLTIIICILLSLVLIFGIVFGTINLVKHSRAVAYFGDSFIDEGEMRFLSSYYKMLFMKDLAIQGITASDTAAFWEKTDGGGVKYGERLKSGFREYVTALLCAAAVYDSAGSFSGDEKRAYEALCTEMLGYFSDGSKSDFNEAAAEFGFDWDDFRSANILLYKAHRAKTALFGQDGSSLINESKLCAEYLETYAHVNLLFIRLEDKLVIDDNGDFVYDGDGEVVTEPLSATEIAKRQEVISTINSLINKENGREISPETFEIYQESYDGDKDMIPTGYYFNDAAEATAEFKEEFPEIVSAAYEMKIGEYRMVECPAIGGVCFIYREAVVEGAYARESNPFFSDFYSDGADYLFPRMLKDLAPEVTFKNNFSDDYIITQPKNNKYYIKSFN